MVEGDPGFDPLWLQPDASLNRTRLAPLPGAEPAWVGRPAFDLLSRAALLELIRTLGESGARQVFGRRVGHLIASLHRGGDDDTIQSTWRRAYRSYWRSAEEVWLAGGLVAYLGTELLEAARTETARLSADAPQIALASLPWVLPLIGAARLRLESTAPERRIVLDLGHSAIKRGVASYASGAVHEVQLLKATDAPERVDAMGGVTDAIAEAFTLAGPDVGPIIVSLASYLDRDGCPVDSGSLYAGLRPATLQAALRERAGTSVKVHLIHDGTAAACGVVPTLPRAAVIMLGTALGVGFPPPPQHLRSFAPDWSVREALD